jgi:histidinol-phosphatase (PHP family)
MLTSYHNHTNMSDGACTLEQQIEGAHLAGLDELGISDHYVGHPELGKDWSMPIGALPKYVETLVDAAAQLREMRLRIGVEADYFPETVESLRASLDGLPFDYVIGSVHYVGSFPVDGHMKHWNALSQDEIDAKWRRYWQLVAELAGTGLYDIVAHIDLPKKFGHRPSIDLTAERNAALDAVAAAGMAIEINTAGWSLPAKEGYPAPDILRAAREREIPLVINADAHSPKHLTRDFDKARALARECGYTEVVRFDKRKAYSYAMPAP